MAMGQLAKTAIISYESKNRTSGLTDIEVTIRRPNGLDIGPFSMIEDRPGFYRYNFLTTLLDLEGDYLGFIKSPSESNYETQVKLSLFLPGASGGGGEASSGIQAVGKILNGMLVGKVVSNSIIKGIRTSGVLIGRIQARTLIQGKILNGVIKGKVL